MHRVLGPFQAGRSVPDAAQSQDGGMVVPARPAIAGGARPLFHLRTAVVAGELALVLALLLAWLLSDRIREGWSLWLFFLYSFPAEFLVALVPHDVPLIHLASRYDPLTLALVAGTGAVLTEALNYAVLRRLMGVPQWRRAWSSRPARRAAKAFERAPFLALWIAGATPVLPFFPLRFLAVSCGYPRGRYLLAGAVSRTPRFYLVALLGRSLSIPTPVIAGLFVILVVALAPRSILRWLVPDKVAGEERS